jgi:hypothetical protein
MMEAEKMTESGDSGGKEKGQQQEEEKEGKEEKKDYDGEEEKRKTDSKFRLDTGNTKHVAILRGLVPIFLDIMQHMGSILHGLNTCAVEQFARER